MFDFNLGLPLLPYPARIYLFKVNSGNTRTMCENCLEV